NYERQDLGSANSLYRPAHRASLQLTTDSRRAANASRIDKDQLRTILRKRDVDRVASCPGDVIDNRALETGEAIQQRRFANIRSANQCDFEISRPSSLRVSG